MNALDHVFTIVFTCPECPSEDFIPTIIEHKITHLLSTLNESGWPICHICGCDMDHCVKE